MVVITSFVEPDSPVRCEQRNVRAILDKKDLGLGTLLISERTLGWKENDIGFSLAYQHISLHAISTDPVVYSKECIYIMIDTHVTIPGTISDEKMSNDDSDSDAESEADISELILVPDDASSITSVYEAIKECQSLNPDPEDMEDEEDDIYEDADEGVMMQRYDGMNGEGDHAMDNLVTQMRDNSVDVNRDYSNGDHINEDIYEDAD